MLKKWSKDMRKVFDLFETICAWFIVVLLFAGVPTFLFIHSIVTVWE